MKRMLSIFITTGILLISLVGCLLHLAHPQQIPIQRPSGYRALHAAVAVDGSGALHIVHSECRVEFSDICSIHYRKVKAGAVLASRSWMPPANGSFTSYSYPDIAVTNSGTAYIAWRYENSAHEFVDLWTRSDSTEPPWMVEPGYLSNGLPQLATNGEVVFILTKVVDGTGNALRYKRLYPVDPWVGGWVSPHGDNVYRWHENAAVSPDNKLYVTWAVYNSGSNDIYYNDNHNSAANMTNLRTIVSGRAVSAAKIDVSKAGDTIYVFMLYQEFDPVAHPDSDDLRVVICDNDDCHHRLDYSFNLPSAEHWAIGGYDLAAVGDHVYVVFTASKDGLPFMQVFRAGYDYSPPAETLPTQLTNIHKHHSLPQVMAIPISTTDYLVMSYQRDVASCDYSLYEYDTFYNQEVLIGEHVFGAQDMAMNASAGEGFLGGVWVMPGILEGDGRWAIWFSYNDAPLFLPFIRR